ncbi:hypothetical protein HDV05_000195 [Chytridiales sp. JEL 0842]|nr:hypothetical protein HDV05_000195 [Chytridiales sp. JEL 0842]
MPSNAPEASTTERSGRSTSGKGKSKAKGDTKKTSKRKKMSDDEDSDFSDGDNGQRSNDNIGKLAPRSGFSKRRKDAKQPGDTILQFCNRCLRKYIPAGDEDICGACMTIPVANGKKSNRMSMVKQKKAKLVGDAEDGTVPSLKNMCIKLLAANISFVEEFGDIPDEIKRSISRILSRQRLINADTMNLFIGPTESKIELFDCARLTADKLSQIVLLSPNVRTLNLSDCGQIIDSTIADLVSSCQFITSLTLKGPFLVTDKAFAQLFSSLGEQLEELCLENAAKLGSGGMAALAAKCPNLRNLTLSHCMSLRDEGLKVISGLTAMKKLELMYLEGVTDEVLVEITSKLGHNLTHLALTGFAEMADTVLLDGVGAHCKELCSLSLYGCESLTDDGITKFLNMLNPLPNLRQLDLGRIINLKDDSIVTVVNLFGSSLEFLNINGLDELTEYSLRTLLNGGCPNIVELDLSWIRDVDDDLFQLMVTKNHLLKTVKVYGCHKLTEFSLVKKFYNKAGSLIKVVGNEFD